MHFLVLVVCDDLLAALAPFRVCEVAVHPRTCPCRRRAARDWTKAPHATCKLCRGSGLWSNDANPEGRWDSFVATHGRFVRREGVAPMRRRDEYVDLCWAPSWIGDDESMLPRRLAQWAGDWDVARKRDLDLAATFGEKAPSAVLPYAMVVAGRLHQSGDDDWFPEAPQLAPRVVFERSTTWQARFDELFAVVDDDAVVTLVDCHG